jgi:hypothetical protein
MAHSIFPECGGSVSKNSFWAASRGGSSPGTYIIILIFLKSQLYGIIQTVGDLPHPRNVLN